MSGQVDLLVQLNSAWAFHSYDFPYTRTLYLIADHETFGIYVARSKVKGDMHDKSIAGFLPGQETEDPK